MSEEQHLYSNRADPTFKDITIKRAQALGIKIIGAELPQTTTADMVFEMPSTVQLAETLFSFLSGFEYAIIDFKGQNDNLDMTKFLANAGRTSWFCNRHPEAPVHMVLNLIVSARYPQEFINEMQEAAKRKQAIGQPATDDLIQMKEQPWLWRGSYFAQEVAIVVCRDLPLEPRYYEWLLFAPANSKAWKELVRTLLREGQRSLLEIIKGMRPKEFRDMKVTELTAQLEPQERENLLSEWGDVMAEVIPEMAEENPVLFEKYISTTFHRLTPQQRAILRKQLDEADNEAKNENENAQPGEQKATPQENQN